MYTEEPITEAVLQKLTIQEVLTDYVTRKKININLDKEDKLMISNIEEFIRISSDEDYELIENYDNFIHVYDHIIRKLCLLKEIESMTSAKVIEESVRVLFPNRKLTLGTILRNYMESSDCKNHEFDFNKILNDFTLNEILGECFCEDPIIDNIPMFDDKVKEVINRFFQIDAANREGNLTYDDICEILGSVKVKYLQPAYAFISSANRLKKPKVMNSRGKWKK